MSGIWPGKTKCVVMLSFDLDGVSGLLNRFPEAAGQPSALSRAEFGPRVGVYRILDLLDEIWPHALAYYHPLIDGSDDTLYFANEKAVPAVGTPVTVIFSELN